MSDLEKSALPAVENLIDASPEELFSELELRRRLIAEQPRSAGSFDAESEYRANLESLPKELSEFGRRFFQRFSRDVYDLLCGSDSTNADTRNALLQAMTSKPTFAAALAAVLVSQLGVAPALAAVLAALVVRLFIDNAMHVLCGMWKESIQLP